MIHATAIALFTIAALILALSCVAPLLMDTERDELT